MDLYVENRFLKKNIFAKWTLYSKYYQSQYKFDIHICVKSCLALWCVAKQFCWIKFSLSLNLSSFKGHVNKS